jgi:hypothetical protein
MNNIIAWWSGGITSAVTCRLCIDLFGLDNVRLIFIDTKNEDPDTYRFKTDCEKWYGKEIETITSAKYSNIEEVWYKFKSLNVAHGAICSSELKREVRKEWGRHNTWSHQAFGFSIEEPKRALSMSINYPDLCPIFPLLMYSYTKKQCIKIVQEANIIPPITYQLGFLNNNCFRTGCVQGGVGYWQKMGRDFPPKFYAMAKREHDLTNLKGKPVTMLKEQGKEKGLVFLMPHPNYPNIKDISMMKGREPEPLMECNGFCGVNDLEERKESENDINYEQLTMDI